jgi:hypothetical protein
MNNHQHFSTDDNFQERSAAAQHAAPTQPHSPYQKAPSLSAGAGAIFASDHLHSQLYASHYKPHTNQLSRAIMDGEWLKAATLVRDEPSRARKTIVVYEFMGSFKTSKVLPIHLALSDPKVPIELIQILIQTYPGSLRKVESGYQRNCIHIALKGRVSNTIISYILQLAPVLCRKQDRLGRLPLHYAIHNGHSLSLTKEVIHVYPEAVKAWDNLWWSPLHVACQAEPSRELILLLLTISPEIILMTTRKGSTALDIARGSKSDRKEEILPILEDFDAMVRNLPVMQNYQEAVSKRIYSHSRFSPTRELHDVV